MNQEQDNGTEMQRLAAYLPNGTTLAPASASAPGSSSSDGVPVSSAEYNCPVCHDAGYYRRVLPLDHPDFGKAAICPECTGKPEPAGLPDRLKGKTFADFDVSLNKGMRPAYERCKRMAAGEEWCCVLVGPTGLGKSHLAAATLYQHRQGGHFWETGDLLRRLRTECFGEMGPHTPESEALWRWQDYRLPLVLDDMGAEKWTEWASGALYAILNARYQSQLPTIITSNVPEAIDDRLLSRYYEGAVQCAGQDIRRVRRW